MTVVYHRRVSKHSTLWFWRLSFPFSNRSRIDIFFLFLEPRDERRLTKKFVLFPNNRSVTQRDTVNSTANLYTWRRLANQSMIPESGMSPGPPRPFPHPQATAGLASLADIISPRFLPFSPTAKPGPRLGRLPLNKNSSLKFGKFHVHFNNHTH